MTGSIRTMIVIIVWVRYKYCESMKWTTIQKLHIVKIKVPAIKIKFNNVPNFPNCSLFI